MKYIEKSFNVLVLSVDIEFIIFMYIFEKKLIKYKSIHAPTLIHYIHEYIHAFKIHKHKIL